MHTPTCLSPARPWQERHTEVDPSTPDVLQSQRHLMREPGPQLPCDTAAWLPRGSRGTRTRLTAKAGGLLAIHAPTSVTWAPPHGCAGQLTACGSSSRESAAPSSSGPRSLLRAFDGQLDTLAALVGLPCRPLCIN